MPARHAGSTSAQATCAPQPRVCSPPPEAWWSLRGGIRAPAGVLARALFQEPEPASTSPARWEQLYRAPAWSLARTLFQEFQESEILSARCDVSRRSRPRHAPAGRSLHAPRPARWPGLPGPAPPASTLPGAFSEATRDQRGGSLSQQHSCQIRSRTTLLLRSQEDAGLSQPPRDRPPPAGLGK